MSALGDAWLAEMWKPCRELPYGEKARAAVDGEARNQQLAEWRGEPELPLRETA